MSSLQQVLQAVVGSAFEILKELPGGGMSRVFLAREPALSRDVVIKVLPPDLVSHSSLHRFTREIQVTARLQHPYILPVITAGGNDELRYYVAPFIRGESLRARMASGDPLPFADAVRIGDQLLHAVAFAHGRGVIHRDIKPANVLLSEGHAILADFGIAALTEGEQPGDHLDHVTGSTLDAGRAYVAPEQPRDEARDLFAAAVVIHEMVAGAPAVAGASAAGIGGAIRARHPSAPAADARKLAAILSRALAIEPAMRYRTAGDLRGAIHSLGTASRRQLLAGIGMGGAVAVFALALFALRPQPEAPPPAYTAPFSDTARPIVLQAGTTTAEKPPVAPTTSVTKPDGSDSRAAAQLRIAVRAGMSTSPADVEISHAAAERALRDSASLDPHDRALAHGYVALAERRFPEACDAFERARQARASFEAWFGLGECRTRDDAVIVDENGTPSFRSDYDAAFTAYVNATRAVPNPSVIAYRRMTTAIPQDIGDIRIGRTADRRTFVGHWRVIGDSLAFTLSQAGVPRPLDPRVMTDAAEAARVGRERLRPVFFAWLRQSPDEPMAHEMLALLLENMGAISQVGDDRVSALTEIAQARSLETNSSNALRLATMHARLLLRARDHEALARLADSLLVAHPEPNGFEAEALMPLALLTGRIALATKMLTAVSASSNRQVRGADGRPVELPPSVVAERADFLARATVGVCDDRVRSAPRRMTEQLDAAFPSGVPRGVESAFMDRIVVLALPCVGSSVVRTLREPGRLVQTWAPAFDPSDTAFAARFAARSRGRATNTAPDPGMDAVVVEALARLAMKDSTGALQALKLGLDRLPFINRGVFSTEWVMGATGRGMALAAELADAIGDRETARRWAPFIAALWKNADPELQPELERLEAIAIRLGDPQRE